MKTYRPGTLAYLDSFRGLVPCKVIAVYAPGDGNRIASSDITVRITAKRPGYTRGEVIHRQGAFSVVPRKQVFTTRGFHRWVNSHYRWEP